MPHFVLDEAGFDCARTPASDLENVIENFCDHVYRLRTLKETVYRWSELENCLVSTGNSVSDLLYCNILPKDTQKRFVEAINRCVHWDSIEEAEPEDFDIAGQVSTRITLRHAFLCATQAKLPCCLGLVWKHSSGLQPVTRLLNGDTKPVFFYEEMRDHAQYYRELILFEDIEDELFIEFSTKAFPNLYFAPGIGSQIRRFAPFDELMPTLVHHLGVLNDHFRSCHQKHQGLASQVQSEMQALHRVVMSPESDNTRGNDKAIKKRDVKIPGATVRCEWHTKLSPTVNRIHFHPGIAGVAEGKIIVGIFTDHLPT